MNEPTDLSVYKETLLFLVTAGVVAPLFFRLRISPVLGYLLAGVALGPYGLGRDRAEGAVAQRACDQCRVDRPHRRLWRRRAHVHHGARAVVRAAQAHAPSGVRAWARAGRRDDADPRRRRLAPRPQPPFGARDRGGAVDVVDRDRHSDAGREQAASFCRRPGESIGAAVSGSRGRAPARHDGRVVGGGRARPRVAAPDHARSGGARSDRPGHFRPARVAAILPFCRGNQEPRVLHGGLPLGGARRWVGRRGEPFVDGARRLCRRAPAGGDRISPRDRSDDRAVPRPPARALLRLGRRRDQSGVHHRAARPHSWSRRGAGGGEGSDAVRTRAGVSSSVPRGRRDVAPARARRRVRLRDDRRRAGGRPDRSHAGDDAHQRGGDIDACDSGPGEARRAHWLEPARRGRCEGAGDTPGQRGRPASSSSATAALAR